jgi:hypothetical protein
LKQKVGIFRVLIYVASVLSNPLLIGGDEKKVKEAEKATQEALFVAEVSKVSV